MGESVLTGPAVSDSPLFEDAGLERRDGSLHLGGASLSAIADAVGTPTYLYNARVLRRQFRALDQALSAVPHRVAFAVKANANLGVLRILRDLGAGADIVSGGELARALAAGFEPAFVERVATGVRQNQFKRMLPVIAKLSNRTIGYDFWYGRDWGT